MMDSWAKVKEWINENVPMLSRLYSSKYVGMLYDRFASLPPKQQKQVIYGLFAAILVVVTGYLSYSYLALWSQSNRAKEAYEMVNMLQQYKANLREKAPSTAQLQRNSQLAAPGQMKNFLLEQGRNAGVSPKTMQVDERDLTEDKEEDGKTNRDIKAKQASVVLERVNLLQLKNFLNNIEFGGHNLSVSSLRVQNDPKIRGYMRAELSVVTYIFQPDDEGGGANG